MDDKNRKRLNGYVMWLTSMRKNICDMQKEEQREFDEMSATQKAQEPGVRADERINQLHNANESAQDTIDNINLVIL